MLNSIDSATRCAGGRDGGTIPGSLGGYSAIRPTARGALLLPLWVLLRRRRSVQRPQLFLDPLILIFCLLLLSKIRANAEIDTPSTYKL